MDEFMLIKKMNLHPLLIINDDQTKLTNEIVLNRSRIRVLTYNLFLRPPPVKNNESDWKDERLIDFLQEIDNYDILCLQEVFEILSDRRHELIRIASKAGFFFYCKAPIPSFFSKFTIDGGLLILSRFPIISSEFIPFDYGVLSDALSYKGFIYAHIKIADADLVLFNLHAQASYFDISQSHFVSA
jgi:endonuclease/exonuclease/phosphatase family metal-dependent hydrolase